jgi:PAS domain S-box-containing protein
MNPTETMADGYSIIPFFETSPNRLCIAGFHGYFKLINPAVCKLLGYAREELTSRPIRDFIHPQDSEITSLQRESILKGNPLLNYENRYITKSGETRRSMIERTVKESAYTWFVIISKAWAAAFQPQARVTRERPSRSNLKILQFHRLKLSMQGLNVTFFFLGFAFRCFCKKAPSP